MSYEYTVEDRIETPVHYHYAEYRGTAFMRDWFAGREEVITRIGETDQALFWQKEDLSDVSAWEEKQKEAEEIDTSETFHILQCELLNRKVISAWMKEQLDGYVKTFEVRKRLYSYYSFRFKPIDEEAYRDLTLYTSFACICAAAFEIYRDLRYLNVLLKVNDTLLSRFQRDTSVFGNKERSQMRYAVKKEMDFITAICREKGIVWGRENDTE